MQLMNNSWYIVLESADLKNKPLQLKRFGKTMVMWRDASGKVNCIDDRCPHRGASLALGKIKDGCITCPFHGIAFDGEGKCKEIPFVHEKTIGRGFKPASTSNLSNALEVTFENEVISASMKTGRGTTSRFRFMFPNAWQLRLSPFAFLFVAFCPIDDENTMMILRSYVKGQSFKGLKTLALQSSPLFNHKILSEDEAIVVSQTLKAISQNMDEHLLALDKPIALFRKHYFERLKPVSQKPSASLVPLRKV